MVNEIQEGTVRKTSNEDGEVKQPAKIEMILSRSCYNIGDTVVGTIRLIPGNNTEGEEEASNSNNQPSSDSDTNGLSMASFTDAIIYITGKCRLDSRWHNYKQVTDTYGSHPILNNLPIPEPEHVDDVSQKQTVCFFATNFVSLLELPGVKTISSEENATQSLSKTSYCGFTFRVDLPHDIPPSAHALCCRYFYTAVASARLITGKVRPYETF